jgi:tetratricopeptide (TPR) repeat protein
MFAMAAALLNLAGLDVAQAQPPHALYSEASSDPFWVPPELLAFARRRVAIADVLNGRQRAEELLKALVLPENMGGLGIKYSGDTTRTINEVWVERKANCVSLTMMYVMLAKQLKIPAVFAETVDAMSWSRVGGMILRAKHMVALVFRHPQSDLIADFHPRVVNRFGNYFVTVISDSHAKSLYYSNQAVDTFIAGDHGGAMDLISIALEVDPVSSQAWNIKGVIEKSRKNIAGAINSYRLAIRNDPKNATAIGNLAMLYRSEGMLEESLRLMAAESRLRKSDPYYFAFLALEALEQNDLAKARKSIQSAIKIHPGDPDFYVTLSQVCLAQNKPAEAIDALMKARGFTAPEMIGSIDLLLDEYRARLGD